jgi:biopolymer transport protein TolR
MAGASFTSQRRFKKGARRSLSSDINVTPFVDVMLVLLVIFMVTAPLMTAGVPVDLPKSSASAISENVEPLTVSITSDNKIYIQDTEVGMENLIQRLQAVTEAKPDTRIYVRGDQQLSYGRIMEVVGAINAAGFNKVALMTEMHQSSPAKASEKAKTQPSAKR